MKSILILQVCWVQQHIGRCRFFIYIQIEVFEHFERIYFLYCTSYVFQLAITVKGKEDKTTNSFDRCKLRPYLLLYSVALTFIPIVMSCIGSFIHNTLSEIFFFREIELHTSKFAPFFNLPESEYFPIMLQILRIVKYSTNFGFSFGNRNQSISNSKQLYRYYKINCLTCACVWCITKFK